MSEEKPAKEKHLNPLQTIKQYCKYDCCLIGDGNDGATDLWKNCEVTDCKLWDYRMGTNPHRKKREMTEEQKAEVRERLKKAREKK